MSRIWKRLEDNGDEFRQPDQVRKNATTVFKNLYLVTMTKKLELLMSAQIVTDFAAAAGNLLSIYTINNRLHKKGTVHKETQNSCSIHSL